MRTEEEYLKLENELLKKEIEILKLKNETEVRITIDPIRTQEPTAPYNPNWVYPSTPPFPGTWYGNIFETTCKNTTGIGLKAKDKWPSITYAVSN